MTRSVVTTWMRRVLIALAATYAIYLVGVNALLNTGALERLISRRPVKFQIGWEWAWTVLPGRAHVGMFSMQGQTRTSQWRFELDHGVLDIRLRELFLKGFHATRVRASGARLRIRRQRIAGEPLHQGAHLEPVIQGMTETRPPLEQLQPRPKRRFPWKIQIEDIEVEHVAELWLATHRFAGDGEAEGELRYVVGGELEISDARLELPVAHVFTGGDHVGRQLEVMLELGIAPTRVSGTRFREILPSITAHLDVVGLVSDFGFLNLYFRRLPNLRLEGAGFVDCRLGIDRGSVTSESAASFESHEIALLLKDFELRGEGVVDMAVTDDHQAVLHAEISGVGFSGGGRSVLPPGRRSHDDSSEMGPHARGPEARDRFGGDETCGLAVSALSSMKNLADPFTDLVVRLDLPDCDLNNLTGLNELIPENLPVTFLPDSKAVIGARLDLSETAGAGRLRLRGNQLAAVLHQLPVVGDMVLALDLEADNVKELSFDLSGSRLEVQNLSFDRPDALSGAGWWARVALDEARLELAAPVSLSSRVELGLRDTLPLIAAFSPPGKASLLAGLLDLEELGAAAQIHLGRAALEITDLQVWGSGFGRALLGGAGAAVSLYSARLDPMQGFEGLEMELDLPGTEVEDLAVLNDFIPDAADLEINSGSSGTVSAHLELDDRWFAGFAEVSAQGVGLEVCNLPLIADLGIHLQIPGVDIDDRLIDLSGSQVWFDQVVLPGEPRQLGDEWRALIRVEEGYAELTEPLSVDASVIAWMRDTRPLIAAYLPVERTGMRLEDLLDIEDVTVGAQLYATREALSFDDLEISGRGTAAGHLLGPGFAVKASSLKLDTAGGFTDLDLAVDLPRSKLVDLAALNPYIPEKTGLAFGAGSGGVVSAWLRVADGVVAGEAELSASSIELDLGEATTVGDLDLMVKLKHGDLESQRFEIGGSSVVIDEAVLPGSELSAGDAWWARVDISRGEVELSKPFALDTSIYLEMGDSRPLVRLVTREGGNQWLEEILSFNEVVGSVKLNLSEEAVTVSELEIRGLGHTGNRILGPGIQISASGSDIDFESGLDGLDVTLDLPESQIRDLSVFNRYLSKTAKVALLPGGQGTVKAHLELASGRGIGEFQLRGSGFGAQIGETIVRGDLDLDVRVMSGDLEDPLFDIAGSRLRIDEMSVHGSDGSVRPGWSAAVLLTDGTVRMGYPLGVDVDVELTLSDTWPLVSYAAEKSTVARLLKGFLTVDNVRGRSTIELDRGDLVFDELALTGEGFEAEGRLKLFEGGGEGLLFFALRRLSAAVKLDGDERKWKLFGSRKWYERRLPEVDFGRSKDAAADTVGVE